MAALLAAILAPATAVEATPVEASPMPEETGESAESPAGLPWHDRLEDALAAAERTGRPILVDLYADWCGLCHKLEREVFASDTFRDYASERFVFLRVDIDDGGEGSRLRDRFASSVPTVVLLDRRMALIGIVRGYHPARPFIARLEIAVEKHREVLAIYERLLLDDDAEQLLPFADSLLRRGDGARAATIYRRLLARGYEAPGGEIRLRFRLADALRLAQELAAAEEQVRLIRRYPGLAEDRDLSEALALLEIAIARDRSDCAGATDAVEAFLDQYPKSRRTGQALATLRSIETDPRAKCQ